MKYVIMCGGKYDKWSIPRHLTKIGKETIVERTIRLLRECGVKDIYISATDSRFSGLGVPILVKENNSYHAHSYNNCDGYWCDGFYLIDEPVCYIFGDVFFSPKAIKTIVETETNDIEFFASAPPFASGYRSDSAEPFALKVVNKKHLEDSIAEVKRLDRDGKWNRRPIMWELWQVIKQTPINIIDYGNYVAINDYTCDVDNPGDEKHFLQFATRYKLAVMIPTYNQSLLQKAVSSVPFRKDIIIVVCDDGSPTKYCDSLQCKNDLVVIKLPTNKGPGAAMNAILDYLERLDVEYLVRLDSDDYFLPGLLDIIDNELSGEDVIYYNLETNTSKWSVILTPATRALIPGAERFWRRRFVNDTRYPEIYVAEDAHFNTALLSKNPTEKYLNRMVVHYNWPREGSLTATGGKVK